MRFRCPRLGYLGEFFTPSVRDLRLHGKARPRSCSSVPRSRAVAGLVLAWESNTGVLWPQFIVLIEEPLTENC